ncbi:MAG: polymerase sigma70 factor [Thermoleophilia bacterium]|nr:polymerase sigma70 factor [Thermoleophilia bacterium]
MPPTSLTDAPSAAQAARDDSDAALIERSLGEPSEFERLFERHHDLVFRYAVSRIGTDGAEDLVGESFLAAFSVRHRFDAARGTDARPWLLGIATKRIARHRSSERRWLDQCAVTARQDAADAEPSSDGAVDRADAARLAPQLASALAQLSSRERDPLLLHVLGNLPYEEVAAALGIAPGTVRSRISRARTRLAGILDGAGR